MMTNLPDIIKGKIIRKIYSNRNPIVIAGLGRCGTTLMYNSILENHYYLMSSGILMFDDEQIQFGWNELFKTHDYPPKNLPNKVKLIFMFGNPLNTVISAHRLMNHWGQKHHEHLRSNQFRPNNEILKSDTLKLHELFDAWNQVQNFSFISVRYETLYSKKTLNALSDYLGFRLQLLPQQPRISDWETHPKKKQLLSVYGDLHKKILDADDVKIWSSK